MKRKILITSLAATLTFVGFGASGAMAQPAWVPPGNDPDGYYSQSDHNGYYDHNGSYRHIQDGRDYGPPPPPPPPPPPDAYYQPGQSDCHNGNAAAGTVFGALAGGLIGGAASRGNGGAVVGGAILGGLLGNAVSRDIDCEDQPYAFRVYSDALNGPLGVRAEWHNRGNYGYFTPVREYRRDGLICRDFTETSWRRDQSFTRTGTACRQRDGNWRFD